MEEEEEEKGKDVRGEDTERRGENKGFEYWYNIQKYPPCENNWPCACWQTYLQSIVKDLLPYNVLLAQ